MTRLCATVVVLLLVVICGCILGGCMMTQKELVAETKKVAADYQSEDVAVTGVVIIKPSVIWGTGLINESMGLVIVQSVGAGSLSSAKDTQTDTDTTKNVNVTLPATQPHE